MIEALHKTEMKGIGALALFWLSEQADSEDRVQASTAQIMAAVRSDKKTVLDAMRALIELGEVEVVEPSRGRKPHTYRILNRISTTEEQAPAETFRDLERPRQKCDEAPLVVEKTPHKGSTSGVRSSLRATISCLAELLFWCRTQDPGAISIYHIGQIGYDRTQNTELNSVVETVQLFAETGFLVSSQQMIALPGGRQIAYTVAIARDGYAPRSVLQGEISAQDYRALTIIQHRASALSATRALRDGLGVSEIAASNVLRALTSRKMLERGPGGGWFLTEEARRLVL